MHTFKTGKGMRLVVFLLLGMSSTSPLCSCNNRYSIISDFSAGLLPSIFQVGCLLSKQKKHFLLLHFLKMHFFTLILFFPKLLRLTL